MEEQQNQQPHGLPSDYGAWGEPPKFILKPVKFFRTALSRQVAEAVRIRRRGGAGAILNSKSENNRCQIPRLRIEEEEDDKQY